MSPVRLIALALPLTCLACGPRRGDPGDAYERLQLTADRLIQRLPRDGLAPQAATRPGLLGDVLFESRDDVMDGYVYAGIRDEDGRVFLLRRGGFAYTADRYGPILPGDVESRRLLDEVRRLSR